MIGVGFNASCHPFNNNNSTQSCLTGSFTYYRPYEGGGYDCHNIVDDEGFIVGKDCTKPDFGGNISVYLTSPNPILIFNTTNPNVWTSNESYQGVGVSFAPLGYWYFGASPILQVAWDTTNAHANPCNGLQVYLSEYYEGSHGVF